MHTKHGRLSWYNCCKKLCLFFYLCFIEDEGYEFNINGQIRKFRGSIAYISGDNWSLKQIGCLKEGSQTYRKCRECKATTDELQSNVRTCIIYHKCVADLALFNQNSLNWLQYFCIILHNFRPTYICIYTVYTAL